MMRSSMNEGGEESEDRTNTGSLGDVDEADKLGYIHMSEKIAALSAHEIVHNGLYPLLTQKRALYP